MLFLSLAWLPLAVLIQSSAARMYFVTPPDEEKDKGGNDDNPVYGIGQEIEIEFHLDDSSAYPGTANLWMEGPPSDEFDANDINNYIDQLAPDIGSSEPPSESDSSIPTYTPTSTPSPPPPPSSPSDGTSIQPPPGAALAKTTPSPPGKSELTNNAMLPIKARSDSFKISPDGSVKYTWMVHLVNNPIAQSLIEKNGFAMARFRLDDIRNPQHKLARSRYFNITKRAVTPFNTLPPPSSTSTSSRAPSSSSPSIFVPTPAVGKGTNTAGIFTKRVTIGVAVGGTFTGLLTFGIVAFCLWRRFRKAALIRLDDETNDPDATDETNTFDAAELEWSEKVGIGRPEPAGGFEITIVQRLETIHEDFDENSAKS